MNSVAGKEMEKVEGRRPKIMTEPLPQILDDLENYIRRVEEAVRQAQAAAKESREAAAQAKISGERAAEAAKKAAEAAVSRVKEEAAKAMDAMGLRISAIESDLKVFKDKVSREALALDQAFLAAKNKHIEDSPFLQE